MNQLPKRKSPRANFHNYSKGIFFVMICTKDKQHFFGEIKDGEMVYTKVGEYTLIQLQEISLHYPYAEIFEMVVMPNHVHFLIEIYDKVQGTHEPCGAQSNGNIRTHEPCVPTNQRLQNQHDFMGQIMRTHEPCGAQSNDNQRTHGPCVPTERTALSVVIGGFKRAVTMFSRKNNINFGWQSRYHDHIIRGFNDFNKIGEYIRNNIGKWEEDCFYQI